MGIFFIIATTKIIKRHTAKKHEKTIHETLEIFKPKVHINSRTGKQKTNDTR